MIVPMQPEHLLSVVDSGILQEYAVKHADSLCEHGFACLYPGVVGCAGLVPHWPGRAVGWAFFRDVPQKAWFEITKAARAKLHEFRGNGFNRIEITVKEDFMAGHRWAMALGFKPGPLLRKYGPDGSDHRMWEML